MARIFAVVVAAGQSSRMGGANKQLHPLAGVPVLQRSLGALEQAPQLEGMVLVAPPSSVQEFRDAAAGWDLRKITAVVPGGLNRQQSVLFGLLAVPFECEIVLVHDGARPLVSRKETEDVISAAVEFGAATLAVPVKDTVKVSDYQGFVAATPDRKKLWLTHTPQGFAYRILMDAHRLAADRGDCHTDDASLVEAAGHRVKLVRGCYGNIKITTPEDILVAEALLKFGDTVEGENPESRIQNREAICDIPSHFIPPESEAVKLRIGFGYDVHRLVYGRKLILGGVEVPYEKGLEGHSDADVLAHAIMDALLGAAGLGDIGRHFPDNDPSCKGASSISLLSKVREKLSAQGYAPHNIDSTIVAQAPRLSGYIERMKDIVAVTLGMEPAFVNIKATTTEGLGFAGAGEGIASYAVALILEHEG